MFFGSKSNLINGQTLAITIFVAMEVQHETSDKNK